MIFKDINENNIFCIFCNILKLFTTQRILYTSNDHSVNKKLT